MKSFWTLAMILGSFQGFLIAADASSVAKDANTIHPLLVGAAAPSVTVKTPEGAEIDLAAYVKETPTILVFYRGSWCPFCMKQLVELEKHAAQLKKQGYRIAAISQDTPKANKTAQAKHKLSFPILSDASLEASQKYGLVFQVDSDTVKLYKGYGIDLVGLYGRTQPLMPVPGVFVFDKAGKIQLQYVNPDYRFRLAPEVLLAAAKLP